MAKSVFSVLSNEFPKSELTISFRVYLNFLMGQFTLDKKLISKHYTFISEFVENKIKYYENLLADGAWSFDCFFNDNPKNYFYFNDLIVRAKSLSIVLSNLKYFKIYIDFYKDSKNH